MRRILRDAHVLVIDSSISTFVSPSFYWHGWDVVAGSDSAIARTRAQRRPVAKKEMVASLADSNAATFSPHFHSLFFHW